MLVYIHTIINSIIRGQNMPKTLYHSNIEALTTFIPCTSSRQFGIHITINAPTNSPSFQHYSCFGTLTFPNGTPVQFPTYSKEQIYFSFFNKVNDQKFHYSCENNYIVIFKKVSCFIGTKQNNKQKQTRMIQVCREKMAKISQQLGQTFQRIFLYLKAINILLLKPCSTTKPYSNKRQNISNKLNKLQINLKSSRLNLMQKVKLVLLKSVSIQIAESGTPNTKISVVANQPDINQKNSDQYLSKTRKQITHILQKQLNDVLDYVMAEVITSKQQTNLHVIDNIEQRDNYNLEIIGGVSAVKRMFIQYISYRQEKQDGDLDDTSMQKKSLYMAKKCLKDNECQQFHQMNNQIRFNRQLEVIRKIIGQSCFKKFYLLDYFYQPQIKNAFYADWEQFSLNNYLENFENRISIKQMIDLSIQIILIVIDLHACGIVHRDLKPSNFMIRFRKGQKYPTLKLIDFGDSFQKDGNTEQIKNNKYKLYSTSVYCPLQTSTFSQDYIQKGINKQKIDNWSIGLLIYKIFYGCHPITYSVATSKDIHTLWKNQFMNQIDQSDCGLFSTVGSIIKMLSCQLIKISQDERMMLEKALAILLLARAFVEEIKDKTLKKWNQFPNN